MMMPILDYEIEDNVQKLFCGRLAAVTPLFAAIVDHTRPMSSSSRLQSSAWPATVDEYIRVCAGCFTEGES
jgi:hypothetical protein